MSSDPLAWIDLDRDHAGSSPGGSRYGNYLRQNLRLFDGCESPTEFALASWRVATGPVMSPAFVEVRQDLAIGLGHDEDGEGVLLATVRVPVTAYDLRASYQFGDVDSWKRAHAFGDVEFYERPRPRSGRVAVLPTVAVRVALDDLPEAAAVCDGSPEHRDSCVRSLESVVAQLLQHAAPLVDRMRA